MTDRSNRWSLVLIPDHQGVMNVGGRLGAAEGPQAFKRALSRFKGRDGVLESLGFEEVITSPGKDVAQNHERAANAVAKAQVFSVSVVVGGGHDHGFSHLMGVKRALTAAAKPPRLGCINIDAHLDVRKAEPVISSGSPFYLALESGTVEPQDLIEFGIQRHCNAPELWSYVESRKVPVVRFEELRHGRAVAAFQTQLEQLATRCDQIVISLDLDAARASDAPGVSAPQAEGFTSSEIIEMCEIAGRHPKVCSLGIFELNPIHDLDDRTARLAATSAYHFVACALGGGFTILELLISIALLVIISFSIYQATTETYKLRDVLQDEGEFYNGVRMAMTVMNRDLLLLYSPLNVVPKQSGTSSSSSGGTTEDQERARQTGLDQQAFQEQEEIRAAGMDRPSQFWGGAIHKSGIRPSRFIGKENSMSFVSTSHIRVYKEAPESEFAKITYELKDEEDPESQGLPENAKVLVKTEDPDAFNLEDTTLDDDDEDSRKRTYPLMHGIRSMKFRYYWTEKEQWLTSWDTESRDTQGIYPDIVEVTLEVDGPSRLFYEGRYLFKPEIPFEGLDAQI